MGDSYRYQSGKENLLMAEDQFRNFIIFFPTHPRAADAQMKIISILMRQMQASGPSQKDAKRALAEINKFLMLFPNSDFVPVVNQNREDIILKLREMTASISGHILDSAGNPISGVIVSVIDRKTKEILSTTNSDPKGYFEITPGQSKNEFELIFEKQGYESYSFKGDDPYSSPLKIVLASMAEFYCQVADFYFSRNNYVAAMSGYQEAIRYQPDMIAANDGLGRSYQGIGEYEKALAVYWEFIQKYPNSPAVSEFKSRIAEIEKKKH
jgi:outer membrane protein assembly factor BamD (BamD/ComL family)